MKKMFFTTDRRKFKTTRVIIVSREMIPMFFDGEQLVHASSRKTAKAPAEVYTVKQAREVIKMSNKFREKNGFSVPEAYPDEYYTIPVY